MLKFSESCLYFINHVDLPFSSLGLVDGVSLRVIGVGPEAPAANGAGRFLHRQAILHP
jgi:hypothetical protein